MTAGSDRDRQQVVLGHIGKVHGIKGWLKLNSSTTPPENILDYTPFRAEIEGRWLSLEIDQARGLIVHFKGYDDPESARKLTGVELSVNQGELPSLAAGDFYWHQLEGLRVVNQHDQLFGRVDKLLETGANDVLVIAPTETSIDGRERLIPYLKDSVILAVDLDAQTLRVSWEADYLE